MSEVSEKTLIMAIQAIDSEIRRLRAISDEKCVVEDELLLIDFETAAEELEGFYAKIIKTDTNLPAYSHLVGRRPTDQTK